MNPRPARAVEVGLLVLAVAGISFSAPLAAASALPGLAIAFWRTALASVALAPVALARPRPRPTARDGRHCVLAGLLLAAHFGTWLPSLTLTSVAASTALVCTAPLWTAVLARLRGARVPLAVWIGVVASLGGVVVIAGIDLDASPRALVGDVLALVGGLCMAGYLEVGASVRARLDTTTYTLLCYATAAIALLVVALVAGTPLAGWGAAGWLFLVAITVVGQFLGHSLFNRALHAFSASTIAVVTLLEVPGAAVVAALALSQELAAPTVAGVVLLLAGLAVVVRGERAAAAAPTG